LFILKKKIPPKIFQELSSLSRISGHSSPQNQFNSTRTNQSSQVKPGIKSKTIEIKEAQVGESFVGICFRQTRGVFRKGFWGKTPFWDLFFSLLGVFKKKIPKSPKFSRPCKKI